MTNDGDHRDEALLRAALELTGEHELGQILDRMVRCAAEIVGARYAAMSVYTTSGRIERFVHFGLDARTVERIGHLPEGRGLLGELLLADGPIRLPDIAHHPSSGGFPPHHPEMRSFLGVPVRVGGRVFGNLYLTDKHVGPEFDAADERVVVTLAAFAACAIEASVLLSTERDRAAAQSELVRARQDARAQREVLALVLEAQETERARVARDLHDQIGQTLTSVLLGLRLLDDALAGDGDDFGVARGRCTEARELVVEALDEVRRLAFDLRPTVLDDVGLVAAVRRLAGDLTSRSGVRIDLALGPLADHSRLPPDIETVVYRVVQEALTNVARHSQASFATVTVDARVDRIHASIADDGVGFDVGELQRRSLGLAGMAERATLAGGTLTVRSAPTTGTTVVLEVPL